MASDTILIQMRLQAPSQAELTAATRQIQRALSNISANVQIKNGPQAVQSLKQIKTGTDAAKGSMTTFGEAIGLSARRFVAFTSAVAIVGRLTSALSKATREAIKFEREFVKLAQVFDTDVRSLSNLQNSLSDLSREFGLSATVIAKTSVVLAQSGLTARQTEQAMRTLAKTTLAATFDNIASSTEGAVAIMAQFGTEASKLETQLGAINAVSKRFAVESGDIIEAVRRSGGAFRAAGGTLNEFIALFTAVRSTTRESAETIATGFRTIFARLQRPKTIDFFRQLNIELTDGKGNFIGAFEAIKRLSSGLEQAGIKAGSLKFAAIVEQLGGIRQVSRVIPLLQQFGKAERARQVAIAGGASLDKDAAKAQETLAQSFARTTENFRALIREITQTGTFQAFVKIALGLANAFIEVARAIKPLIPLIAALGALKIGKLASSAIRSGVSGAGGAGGLGKGFNKGGKVLGFNRGGTVPGTGNGDTVPAMLEPGEFVIRKSAVQAFGTDRLSKINKYKVGGKSGSSQEKITTTGEKISEVYPSLENKLDLEKSYSANVIKHMLPSSTGKKGAMPPITARVINAMKTKRGLMWQRFEKAIPNVIKKTGPNSGGNAPLDYLKDPGDAKFLPYGTVYRGQDESGGGRGKGNNAITMLAKLLAGKGEKTRKRNVHVYYPQNPSQMAAIVKQGRKSISEKGKPPKRKTKAAGGLIGYANGGAVEVQRFANAGVVGFKPSLTGRGTAPGNVGRKKQVLAQKIDFLEKKALAGRISEKDARLLSILSQKLGFISKKRNERFSKRLGFAKGGAVGTDTVPALLTPGEFVINKESAKSFGYGKLGKINKYAKGGAVGVQKFKDGGDVKSGPTGGGDIVGKLFALSFVFSTLTSMVDGVNKELKPVTDALIAFGITTVIAYKALEFLMKFQGIQTAAGRGQAKGLAKKAKDKLFGGGEKAVEAAVDDVEDEVRKSSNSNDLYLRGILSTLKAILKCVCMPKGKQGKLSAGAFERDSYAKRQSALRVKGYGGRIPSGGLGTTLGATAAGAAAPAAGAAAAAAPQLILLGAAAAAVAAILGIVVGNFTLLASTAEQAKEKAIKAGNQELAIRNADAESKAKSERNAVIATTAVGAAMGAILGPAGAIAGAFVGLVAGVLLGGEALNILVPIVHSVAIALIDFAEWASFGAISLEPLRKAVDGLAASMLPATSRFNNALDALTKATQAASEEIRQKGQKEFDAEQKAFGLATTDKSRNQSLDKQTKILLDTGGKLDANNEGFKTKLKEIQVQREKDLKSSNLRIRQAANEKAGEATAAAKAENVKSIQAEASSRLDNISKLSDGSRSMGRSIRLERELNKGKKVTRDQDNIINKSSLQANGELMNIYDGLIAAGATEREALIQVTQSLDAAGSAAKRFSEALKNSSKFVGGVFRKLFTGPLEESFKTARKLNDAMDVAEGSQTIAGLGRERGSGASDAFGQLIGIGAVTGEQTDEAFRGAIPAGAYQGLEDRLREVNIANDPTGTPEEIEAKVQEGMRKAAEGFFGVDVVAKANQEANVNSAKYLKELAEAERAKKKEDKKAKKKAEKSRQANAIPGVFAAGGVVYANEGTLVNFQPQGTDTVPAMLTPGEFVMKKSAVDKYGGGMMKQINSGNFAGGGIVKPNYLNDGGFTDLHDDIRGELDAWFSVDERKLTKLYESIADWETLQKLDKLINMPYTSSEYSHLADRIKATMGSYDANFSARIDKHTKFLNPSMGNGIVEGGITSEEIEEVKRAEEIESDRRNKTKDTTSGEDDKKKKKKKKKKRKTKQEKEDKWMQDVMDDVYSAEIQEGEAIRARDAAARDAAIPEPRQIDLVQFYESQLGQGPRSGDVDPSKVDLNNPVVVQRLRSNEIAVARAAGAERFKHGGQRIITVGDGSAEQHAKYGTLSDAPTNVDVPYPDMEQVRGGKRVLSNIEREFYAYQGATEAEGLKAGPFSYFQKNYDAILNRTDPLYKRGESAEKKKEENRKINAAMKAGGTKKRTVRVMEDGKMVSKEMEVPVKSRGQIKRELAQEGMTEAEKEADRPASGGLERKEAREEWKRKATDLAKAKLMELSSIQRASIDYGTAIKFPLLASNDNPRPESEKSQGFARGVPKEYRARNEDEQMAFDNSQGAIAELAKPQYEKFRKELVKITEDKREALGAAKGLFAEHLVKQRIFPSVAEALKAGRTEYDSDTSLRDRIDSIIGSANELSEASQTIGGDESLSNFTLIKEDLRNRLTAGPIDYTQYKMPRFNTGGYVNGPAGIDVIPAYLSRGEFVMQSSAVNNIGRDNLTRMNSQNFQNGGSVGGPQTSTMNQEIKVEGGREMTEAGQVLLDAAKTLPTDIQMNVGETTVSVNINGAEVLTALGPEMQRIVGQAVSEQITAYHESQQSGGGLPPQNYGNTA